MQQTAFKYELVIGEDCSTDGTRAIVRSYGDLYPEQIRLLLPERNQGMNANFVKILTACHGQYVAVLDGDDYWTDPRKLQKQVDFLESHLDYAICFHPVKRINEEDGTILYRYGGYAGRESYSFDDLLDENFIPTCSVVFRNGILNFPEWYSSLNTGDWAVYLLIARYGGKIRQLDEIMAAYRMHQGSTWSALEKAEQLEKGISDILTVGKQLGFLKSVRCRKMLSNAYIKLGREYHRLNNKKKARDAVAQSIRYYLFARSIRLLWELYVF